MVKRAIATETMKMRADRLLTALRRVIHAVDLYSKTLERETGLTTAQFLVLRAVRDLGEVTTSRIAAQVSLTQGTVTMIVDRLEARGLIERYRSTTDRRVVHTRLTDDGRKALRSAPPLLHRRLVEGFAALPESEQERIADSLETLARMMGAEGIEVAPILAVGPAGLKPAGRAITDDSR